MRYLTIATPNDHQRRKLAIQCLRQSVQKWRQHLNKYHCGSRKRRDPNDELNETLLPHHPVFNDQILRLRHLLAS
jgi:hypothetical protein